MENLELSQSQNNQEEPEEQIVEKSEIKEPQKVPEVQENKDQPKEVMEKAKENRVELCKRIVLSRAIKHGKPETFRVFLKWLNNIPYVGDVNLWKGAITGKEAGKKLTAGERFNYVAAGGMSALSLISLYEGNLDTAAAEQAMAYVFVNIDTIPYTLKNAAQALENKTPRLAHMMDAFADYIIKKREDLVELGKSLTDNSLTTLDLHSDKNK